MQAVSVYADTRQRQHMVAEYSSPYSPESAEAYLYLCQFKPAISAISTIAPLWDEVVLAVSEATCALWIVNASTRKVVTQLQFNSSCLATAHYIVRGFSDVQLFANTPLVRCSGCSEPAEHKAVIAILTESAVKLLEFADQTSSFRPLTDVPLKKEQDTILAQSVALTAQHIAICRHKRVLSGSGSSTGADQHPSTVCIYYLGETGGDCACIPVPGAICSILLEEDDGTDILVLQFTAEDAIITKKYAAAPLSNIWTMVETDTAGAQLVDRLCSGVYHYKARDMAADIIQYTRPALPCTLMNNLSGKATFAYRNGVLVSCDSCTLRVFIGNILLGQAVLKADDGVEWEPLQCVLTEKMRLVIHAKTAAGSGIFALGRAKARKESCVAIAQKQYPVPFVSQKGMWIPMEDKILCIEDSSAQCLTLDRDRCTAMQATECGDVEIFFTVRAKVVSLVFLSGKGASIKDSIDDRKVSIALLYEQLQQLYQLESFIEAINQKTKTYADPAQALEVEVQRLVTPIAKSYAGTPCKPSLPSTQPKDIHIVANSQMYRSKIHEPSRKALRLNRIVCLVLVLTGTLLLLASINLKA